MAEEESSTRGSAAGTPNGVSRPAAHGADAAHAVEQFRLAARAVNGILYDYDPRLDRVERFHGLREVLGWGTDEVPATGTWWREQIHPDDLEDVWRQFEATEGDTGLTTYRVRHRDGRWLDIEDRFTIVRDADGAIVRLVGCTIDVSERVRAARCRRLASRAAGLGVFEWDPVADVAWWEDDRIYEIFGRARERGPINREEFIRDVLHEDDRDAFIAALDSAQRGGGAFSTKCRIWRQTDRSERCIEFTAEFERDASGEPRRMFGLVRDVTDREVWQQALIRNQQTFEALIRDNPFGVYVVDADFRLSMASAGAREAFKNVRPLIGRRLDEALRTIWPEPFASEALERFRHTLRTGEAYHSRDTTEQRADISETQRYDWRLDRVTMPDGRYGVVCFYYDLSDHLRWEKALSESERRFRVTFENAAVGIAHVGLDGKWLRVNDRICQITGYTREHLLRTSFADITHPEDLEADWDNARRLLAGEIGTYAMEKRYIRKNGTIVPIELTASLARDERGEPSYFISVIQDISLRKAAEEALVLSERSFRTMADTAPAMLWVCDTDNSCTFLSAGWYEFTGQTPGEGLGLGWLQAVHPDDRERAGQVFMDAAARRAPFMFDYRVMTGDGNYRWAIDAGRPLFDSDGEFAGYVGSVIDVHERKTAEEALLESAERLRLAKEAAELGIHDYNVTTGAIGWDARVREIWGVGADETVTMEMFLAGLHPEDVGPTLEAVDRAIDPDGDGVYLAEYRVFSRTDGRMRWVVATGDVTFVGRTPVRMVGTVQDITERKHAEARLKESEERFRTLADNMSQFAWMADASGYLLWYNQRWYDYSGTTLDQMRGKGWKAIHHPDHVERVERKFFDHIERGIPWEDTFPLRGKDGTYRWFLTRAQPLRGPDGRIVRWFGTNTDITEQREAEAALRQSEERFRQLADAMPQLVWVASSDGKVLYYNSQSRRFSGLSENSAGWEWVPVLHPEDQQRTIDAWGQAVATGDVYQCEHRIRMTDGTYRWHLSRAYRVGAGEQARWYGTATDVHELKATQETLRESETRSRRAQRGARVGLWEADLRTGQTFWSEFMWTLYGRTPDPNVNPELVWMRSLHPDDRRRVLDNVRECVEGDMPEFHVEFRIIHPDGTVRWIESLAEIMRDSSGRALGMAGLNLDITVRKAVEDELDRHREHLQQLVEERTAELEESLRRLSLSERMAALGTLAAGLGHDMANVLLPMRMALGTLDALPVPEPGKESLASLGRSTEYLRTLAGGLRMLALNPDEPHLSDEVTGLMAWWPEVEALCRAVLPTGVVLTGHGLESAPPAAIPAHALTQVVFNLIQNAGDALRERGAGLIRVEASAGGRGDQVLIRVIDNGPGMTPDVRARCLEPFFTTKARGRGTGLGLAIVYQILGRYNGSITVESQPGAGATFTVYLPKAAGTPAGRDLIGVIRVSDPRLSAIARGVLVGTGAEIVDRAPEDHRPAVFIVDERVTADEIERLVAGGARRRVVKFGANADGDPRVITVTEPKVAAVRRAVARAVDSMPTPPGSNGAAQSSGGA